MVATDEEKEAREEGDDDWRDDPAPLTRAAWITTAGMLEALKDFNDDAWLRLDRCFRAPVQRFAKKLGLRPEEADDVAQEALLAFASGLRKGNYDPERGRLSSWLFGIAYRKVLKARRKWHTDAKYGRGQNTIFWQEIPGEDEASQTWERLWQQHVFKRCLERVREEVRPRTFRAFELVAIENRSAEDVAAELGITRNAVFIAKHRILKRMRELQKELEDAC